jgi:molybdopterin converting factor small subunit
VARVHFASGLRRLVGGAESVDVPARDVRALLAALEARFPGLADQLGSGIAVAIDGEILPRDEALLEPLLPDSEVHFLPQIGGG